MQIINVFLMSIIYARVFTDFWVIVNLYGILEFLHWIMAILFIVGLAGMTERISKKDDYYESLKKLQKKNKFWKHIHSFLDILGLVSLAVLGDKSFFFILGVVMFLNYAFFKRTDEVLKDKQ